MIEPTPAHWQDSGMLARYGGQQIGGADDVDGQMEEVDRDDDQEFDTLSGCGAWKTLPMDRTW